MELTYTGLKGEDRVLSLKHLNIITGPNASGKTTAAQAIRILALGYDPSLGQRPMDTAVLMRNGEMAITLTFGDRWIKRSIKITEKGLVSGAKASWISADAKFEEHSKAIKRMFGTNDAEVREAMDVRELFSLSPNERADKMLELIGTDDEDPAKVSEEVWGWLLQRLVYPKKKDAPKNWREDVWPVVGDNHRPILATLSPILQGKIASAGIPDTIVWANEQKRKALADLVEDEAARKKLQKEVLALPETHPEEIGRNERDRDELQREIGAWQQRKKEWEAREKKAVLARKGLEGALETLREAAGICRGINDKAEEIDGERQTLMTTEGDLDKMTAPPKGDYAAVTLLRKEAEDLRIEANAITIPEAVDLEPFHTEVASIDSEILQACKSPWREVIAIVGLLREHGTPGILGGPVAHGYERLEALAEEHVGKDPIPGLEARLDQAKKALGDAKIKHGGYAENLKAAEARQTPLVRQAEAKDTEADGLATEIERGDLERQTAYQNRRKALLGERKALRAKIKAHDDGKAKADKAHQAAKGDTETAKATLEALGPASPAPDTTEGEALEGKLKGITDTLKSLRSAVAKRDALEAIIAEIEAAKAKGEVYKALEWALQRKRDAGITIRGGGLKESMQTFLREAGRDEVPYFRPVPGRCEIGWRQARGKEIAIEAMCGGEWCVFASAITAAMVKVRNADFRILLVEAAEAHGKTLPSLLNGIRAVKDSLHTAIVMTPHITESQSIGAPWNIVHLESPHADAAKEAIDGAWDRQKKEAQAALEES